MADWTEERHGHAKVAAEECQARGYTVTSEPGSILDMLAEIERTWGEIERLTEAVERERFDSEQRGAEVSRLLNEKIELAEQLKVVRAIIEAHFADEHAEGHPGASWVLKQAREAMGAPTTEHASRPAPLTEAEARAWVESELPVSVYGGKGTLSGDEVVAMLRRASRGDIPDDVRAEAEPAVQKALRGLERMKPVAAPHCPKCGRTKSVNRWTNEQTGEPFYVCSTAPPGSGCGHSFMPDRGVERMKPADPLAVIADEAQKALDYHARRGGMGSGLRPELADCPVGALRHLLRLARVIPRPLGDDVRAEGLEGREAPVRATLRGTEPMLTPEETAEIIAGAPMHLGLTAESAAAMQAYRDGATVTTTPGHAWERDASGGPTLVPVRPSARPVLDQVYAIVRPFYEVDEHAEGRPAASWVLEQVREAMTAPVDVPHDLREAAMARWAPPPAPVATAEPWAPQVGDRVVTAKRLHPTTVFDGVSVDATNTARRPGAQGRLVRFVDKKKLSPACIVAHDDGTEAPYDAAELLPAPEVKS